VLITFQTIEVSSSGKFCAMLKVFQNHFISLVYWYSVQCSWSAAWCFLDTDCHWRWTKHIF